MIVPLTNKLDAVKLVLTLNESAELAVAANEALIALVTELVMKFKAQLDVAA